MAFPREDVARLLASCHRRCCICHRFCGVKMETDHIVPGEAGGPDTIDNAIPVCFECHAEIHSYNDKHPRGRKFQPDELRLHKEQWLDICAARPEILITARRDSDVGPLQALIDELEFNATVAANPDNPGQGCLFHEHQLLRAIGEGSVAILQDDVKVALLEAYVAMGAANNMIQSAWRQPKGSNAWTEGVSDAQDRINAARPRIVEARRQLLRFLSSS
jgi:hypothetical protein